MVGVEEGCAVKGLWKPEESELFTHPCAGSRANAHDAGGAERVELEANDARVELEADDARVELEADDARVELEADAARVELEADDARVEVEADDARVELEANDARVEVEADDARQWLSGALYHFDAPPLPRLRRSLVSLRAPPLRGRRAALPMAS